MISTPNTLIEPFASTLPLSPTYPIGNTQSMVTSLAKIQTVIITPSNNLTTYWAIDVSSSTLSINWATRFTANRR